MNNEVDDDPRGDNMPDQLDNTLVESVQILDVQFNTSIQSILTRLRHFLIEPTFYTDDFEINFYSWVMEKNAEITNLFLTYGRPNAINAIGFVIISPVDKKSINHVKVFTSSRIPVGFQLQESRIGYQVGVNLLKNIALDLFSYFPYIDANARVFPRLFAKQIIIENKFTKLKRGRPRNILYEECKARLAAGEDSRAVKQYFSQKINPKILNPVTQWRRIIKEVDKDKQRYKKKQKT